MIRTYTTPSGAVQRRAEKAGLLRVGLLFGLLSALGCAGTSTPRVGLTPVPLDLDAWPALDGKAVDLLQRLASVDTSTPPRRERAAAQVLADFLRREGLTPELVELESGRASVYLRLPAAHATRPALVLASHLDAYLAEPELWPSEASPFSGSEREGALWGRGVLDGKGLAVLHAIAVVAVANAELPRDRDLILIATADALGEGAGLSAVAAGHPELSSAGVALTKGGGSYLDLLGDGRLVHALATAEKGMARFEIAALAQAGLPAPGARVTRAVAQVLADKRPPQVGPALEAFLQHLADGGRLFWKLSAGAELGAVLFAAQTLAERPLTQGLVLDEIEVERVELGESRARALLLARLLPGHTPSELRSRWSRVTGDTSLHITITSGYEAGQSELDETLLAQAFAACRSDAANETAAPILATEQSDARRLRELGLDVYGFVPFRLSAVDVASRRGSGEHVAIDNLEQASRAMVALVGALLHSTE